MLQKLDSMFLRKKLEMQEKLQEFLNEEKGASDMAAVMVLIVVVVAIAGVFNSQLKEAVTAAIKKLTDFISATS